MTVVRIVVDSRIRIAEDELTAEMIEALHEVFERKNPSFWMLRRKGLRTWGEPPVLKAWRREGETLTFPRGAWSTVKEVFTIWKVPFTVGDRREKGARAPKLTHFLERRDYQDEAIATALKRENCIIRASTGSGKTSIGIGLIAEVETYSLVVVDSKEIAEEWNRRIRSELEIEPGFIGGGKHKIDRVTVALHQSLAQMKGDRLAALLSTFGCVIADEVQICGADTYGKNIDRMPARYRFGLSDDHHRVDGKTFLVNDLFGAVAHKTGDKELLAQGAIAELDVIVEPTDFVAPWFSERQPAEDGEIPETTAADRVQLIEEMTTDDRRTSKIAARVVAEIAKGQSFLVFSHRVDHVHRLANMIGAAGVPTGLMLGGDAAFDRTRAGLLDGTIKAGVGTFAALGKGVNVPSVDAGYAATPIVTSPQTWRQAVGRIRRRKADGRAAKFWVAWDGKVFGDAPIRKLTKWQRGKVQIAVGDELLSPPEYVKRLKGK